MEAEISTLREDIAAAKAEEKILKTNLITLNAAMSTRDLEAGILCLETEKKELLARLGPLRSGDVQPVSPEEKMEVKREWKIWSRNASVRKEICLEVWEVVTQELPEGKTKEELWVCTDSLVGC